MTTAFISSAPGRLCLFGEHQDYLGLPVIAMAINRRCTLHFSPIQDSRVEVASAALGPLAEYDLNHPDEMSVELPMGMALRSMLQEFGTPVGPGWRVWIESTIPLRAGCSSSTALLTAWTAAWLKIFNGGFDVNDVVKRCHQYEVTDYNGAGGDMDQFACAHGGIHRFGIGAPVPLFLPEGAFVLGDSGQPKDTQGHLRRCKEARIPLMAHIDAQDIALDADDRLLLEGTRTNRDLEWHWGTQMAEAPSSGMAMGHDLTKHHGVLRDVLRLSTPRIEAMLTAARNAGAWGGKINGSGGGGCAFALSPKASSDQVRKAMLTAGAVGAWEVEMDQGVSCQG